MLISIGVKKLDSSEDAKEGIQKLISNFKESKCRKHKPYKLILIDDQEEAEEIARQVRNLQKKKKVSENIKIALLLD